MVTRLRSSIRAPGVGGRTRVAAIACATALALAAPTLARAEEGQPQPTGSEIVMRALSFLGVPYRLGGEDPETGFDCSGLVRYVVSAVLGRDLPRRSSAIGAVGHSVRPDSLAPGDLLFFNTLGRPFSHVGVYIGEGRFVHAPARGGKVRVESMQARYWRLRFNGARRMESTESVAAHAAESAGARVRFEDDHASLDAKP